MTHTKKIFFVTTNAAKFEEVKRWTQELDPSIILEQAAIELPEYQDSDIYKVAIGKANAAWDLFKKPVLIDDGGIYFEQYNNFPGTFAKFVYQGIGLEGIWKLIENDTRTMFLSCLVYKDTADSYHLFEGTCNGHIIKPTGDILKAVSLPYTQIFVPNGATKTLAQIKGSDEDKIYNHRYKSTAQFVQWIKSKIKNSDV